MKIKLLEESLDLFKRSGLSFDDVAKEIGTSGRWVRKVVNREIPDPGIKRVQKLYDFLSEREAA